MEWISVKDRLPPCEDYLDCMVVVKVGDEYHIDNGGWTCAKGYDENGNVVESWGWWVMNDWDEGQGCIVQYWMPYPELPPEISNNLRSAWDV